MSGLRHHKQKVPQFGLGVNTEALSHAEGGDIVLKNDVIFYIIT